MSRPRVAPRFGTSPVKAAARRDAESISDAVEDALRNGKELVDALREEGVAVTEGIFWRAVARRTLRPAEVEAAVENDEPEGDDS